MRRFFFIVSCLFFILSSVQLFAGENHSYLIRVKLSADLSQSEILSRNIDIIAVYPDGTADLAVSEDDLTWIRSRSKYVRILERAGLGGASELDENLGAYHTYAELMADLTQLADDYPSLAQLDTIGYSIEGRAIVSIKISDNVTVDEDEPEVLIMGCHHARELMSVEIPLLLAHYLLENYGTSSQVRDLVDSRETWIVPMVNPDGHVYVQYNHSGDWWNWWRKNRRDNGDGSYGVDLNRNYGYMWGYDDVGSSPAPSSVVYRGTGPFSEPETRAIRDFCQARNFSIALSYHSYGELILFPWGYAPLYTDDHELFVVMSDSLKRGNDYTPGNTAMGNIYVTNGDSDDWMYGETTTKNRIFSFTIELNTYEEGGFAPPDTLILPTFEKVKEMNLAVIRVADDPYRVLGPVPPEMYSVSMLNPPNYELKWSASPSGDHNTAVKWELTEVKNLRGVLDECPSKDSLWVADGFSLSSTRYYSGSFSFYSGSGNNLRNTLGMSAFYPSTFPDTLRAKLWYDIEMDWDYAYLEASLDHGLTWITVPGNCTTNKNPNGSNRGNGITGSSGGWIDAQFYLDSIGASSKDILLRFVYITDSYVANEGIYIDDIYPVPVYDYLRMIASLADTVYHRWPDETGTYAYYVTAFDAEGHASRMSNVVFHTVDDLSYTDVPYAGSTLKQNYPNPFNPVTRISFVVGKDVAPGDSKVPVSLEIFDVSGRVVKVLLREELPSGEYSTFWDGRDSRGMALASGVYFARLVVDKEEFTRKLVILR